MPTDHALLLVTPDLLAQGRLSALLRWLAQHRYAVVAAVPRVLMPPELAVLYASHLPRPDRPARPHAGWLTPSLFAAPTVGLLLRGDADGPGDLQVRLCRDKGPSAAGVAPPDSLRGISPLTDRQFSGVHCPDGEAGYRAEGALIFGTWGLARAERADRARVDDAWIHALMPHHDLATEVVPRAFLARLFARALGLALCDPRTPAAPAAGADAALAGLGTTPATAAESDDEAAAPRRRGALASGLAPVFAALFAAEAGVAASAQDTRDLTTRHARMELWQALGRLCGDHDLTPLDSLAVVQAFERCQCPLPHWDAHRLHVWVAYHGRRAL